MRARQWGASVNGRIVLVTMAVALTAVLVTAVAALPLVALSAVDDAKQQLIAQADALSRHSSSALTELAHDPVHDHGVRVALIDADGAVTGTAARLIGPRVLSRLDVGHAASMTVRCQGVDYVLASAPRAGGGAVVVARRGDDLRKAGEEVLGRVTIALVIGLVVALAAGILLARRISLPLRRTAVVARRLAHGERGLSVPRQRIAEVDDVSTALDRLDKALVTSERRQREFLLSVSHELRTPITAIRGYAEALSDGVITPGETAGVGATLVAETERLDRFVADLLQLARLEAEDFVIERSAAQLGGLVDDTVRAWQGRARRSGIDLAAERPGDPGVIETDPTRVRQLLDGLVENALRMTPAGGRVVVACRKEPGRVLLQVRDSGPGLTDEDIAHAFERGVLRDRYRDARAVGTGLGLSIAARLAQRLGASASAGRAAEGGAAFTVAFPA